MHCTDGHHRQLLFHPSLPSLGTSFMRLLKYNGAGSCWLHKCTRMYVLLADRQATRGTQSQNDVPSMPSDSLKLEGVALMHMVEVKLCVATSSRSAALGMGRVTCSKLNDISLKLDRRESPSTGNFTLAPRP
mmetsp:Transcript_74318/g.177259  ORF Transcript_74318/g.177259 Transcript_74318/m.177259 type:complete len:132 (-) Transcript_74318:508-903(-)